MDEIQPWLENKYIKKYLYPSSFVVQVLIFQIWISFNNDGYCDYRGKYDNGPKSFFKICVQKFRQQC
jgi:hypothetical protein